AGPVYSSSDSVAPVMGPASPADVPMTGPTMTTPQGPTGAQDVFAGVAGNTFADPLAGDPMGTGTQPSGPTMTPPPTTGGGGSGGTSGPSVETPPLPSATPSIPMTPAGPTGPTLPPIISYPPMPGTAPATSSLAWVN